MGWRTESTPGAMGKEKQGFRFHITVGLFFFDTTVGLVLKPTSPPVPCLFFKLKRGSLTLQPGVFFIFIFFKIIFYKNIFSVS